MFKSRFGTQVKTNPGSTQIQPDVQPRLEPGLQNPEPGSIQVSEFQSMYVVNWMLHDNYLSDMLLKHGKQDFHYCSQV